MREADGQESVLEPKDNGIDARLVHLVDVADKVLRPRPSTVVESLAIDSATTFSYSSETSGSASAQLQKTLPTGNVITKQIILGSATFGDHFGYTYDDKDNPTNSFSLYIPLEKGRMEVRKRVYNGYLQTRGGFFIRYGSADLYSPTYKDRFFFENLEDTDFAALSNDLVVFDKAISEAYTSGLLKSKQPLWRDLVHTFDRDEAIRDSATAWEEAAKNPSAGIFLAILYTSPKFTRLPEIEAKNLPDSVIFMRRQAALESNIEPSSVLVLYGTREIITALLQSFNYTEKEIRTVLGAIENTENTEFAPVAGSSLISVDPQMKSEVLILNPNRSIIKADAEGNVQIKRSDSGILLKRSSLQVEQLIDAALKGSGQTAISILSKATS